MTYTDDFKHEHPLATNAEAIGQTAMGMAIAMADAGAYIGRVTLNDEDGIPFAGIYLVEGIENVAEFERAHEEVNA